MHKWLALLLSCAALALVVTGCGDDEDEGGGGGAQTTEQTDTGAGTDTGGGGKEAKGGSVSVSVGDNFFEPKEVKVKAGTTVKWKNDGQAPHTVTSTDQFDSGQMEPGAEFERKFDKAGTFDYECQIHPGQLGKVTVE